MTNHIAILRNLKAFGVSAIIAGGVNFASCQLSRLLWFATREAFNLVCSVALTAWHSPQPQLFAVQHLVGCPLAAVALIRSILHVAANVL